MRTAILLSMLLVACASPDVAIRSYGPEGQCAEGRGVSVRGGVMTVGHAAPAGWTHYVHGLDGWRRAEEITRTKAWGYRGVIVLPESRAILRTQAKFPAPADLGPLKKGDSGGGIYDAEGRCIGLVYGFAGPVGLFVRTVPE